MILIEANPRVWKLFPGMRIVVVLAENVSRPPDSGVIDRRWHSIWSRAALAREYGNAQSHPRVRPWREAMKAIGVSAKRFPTSVESILRRAMKGGQPFKLHPLVDYYNSVSLHHVVPAGGFDLDALDAHIELRVSEPGDRFHALDSEDSVSVPPGEVVYACGREVLTRHLVWRQSRLGLLQGTTSRALMVSEILGVFDDELVQSVSQSLDEGLRALFGAETRSTILSDQNSEWIV